ncbi:winged helix-turn-helix domain-containing protein [Diplocloster agilis]|uniref:Stage 0 sporulation protein A homolog n=1 Tax=Diplocloster agilis TaxID=2850323 RepID=A0A949K0T2_9FIRM|nr:MULTISPECIES: response regulator transcription factor [Lachnospiraceae]MBU9738815.1 response regulator transcription factor [Diplocloster agilis]MBU9745988.1 response regulator transcription factor [Diplocloster agilis]MCU6735958.1 response regulator transcription factor [Suonthocola fibrivorans]SCJ84597.1 Transcriptional regulatory protein YycF [uncultured Clostridium sp.]
MKTILAVDDEEHILELIAYNLEAGGYEVRKAETGEEALEVLNREQVDLVLLDLMLPGIDGIEVLKQIRSDPVKRRLPVIMLTAKSDEISKVIGLELGADDYLGKPFGVHELLARIKAVLRRSGGELTRSSQEEEVLVVDQIVINKSSRVVSVDGKPVELSLKEFELLYLLVRNRGRVLSRDMLLEKIWGYDYLGETRTVDVHIRNLRKKIEKDDNHPQYIITVRGVGYKFARGSV